ncbi:MAG: sigma-70 family RNA polymerase sigma factor [Polyangiales bacterium]
MKTAAWHTGELEGVYRRYSALVHRRACALLGSESEALDVVQDLFASLIERPEQYRGESNLSTFLYSATTHACWTRLRNRRTRERLMAQRSTVNSAAAESGHAEAIAELRELLGRLDEQLAQVAVYYYLDELTHAEIAQILGCSRRQVGNLLERVTAAAQSAGRVSP